MNIKKWLTLSISLIALTFLGGCATVKNNYDPIEPVNRGIYQFNDVVDTYVLRPAAKGYDYITPEPVQKGFTNFFFNLGGVRTIVNDLLQGKLSAAGNDTARFVINSTVGILGFFDVATHMGLDKNEEDFGQTLGVWGIDESPYLVIPFIGPSTLRDGIGRIPDWYLGPYPYIDDDLTRYGLLALDIVETRHQFLNLDETIEEQLDPYSYVRDIYLEKRRLAIADEKKEGATE